MIRSIASRLVQSTLRQHACPTSCMITRHLSTNNTPGLDINVKNHILTIRLDRPQKYNAITQEMYLTLTRTLEEANDDNDVRLVLLTGNGDYYSSGNDLSNFITAQKHPNGFGAGLEECKHILIKFVDSFINLKKFIVAAVNGPAVGIAVTTLPLCDYIIASDKATFQTPFTALGQCPEACSSITFPSILGRARANELLMLNMSWDAHKAKEYGLVAQVIEHDKFAGFTDKFANKVVGSCYPNSLEVSKSLVQSSDYRKILLETNRRESTALTELWASEECKDALQKFFKRSKN